MSKKFVVLSVMAVLLLSGCALTNSISSLIAGSPTETATAAPTVAQPTAAPVVYENLPVDAAVLEIVQQTYQNIYTRVNPSVVNIQVTESNGWASATAEGSGFVWDTQGYIVTNNHVVTGATDITVVFSDGTSVAATTVGSDPQSDLAVIRVNASALDLHPVEIGNSHALSVGDLVIAIGNPYGLAGTMTQGIVSALSRSLEVSESDPFSYSTYTIPDIIQTDAAVNPGNSGGVLLNMQGQVIGVTSAIQSSTDSNAGIAFAIPAHIVQKVVPVLIQNGSYAHPSLGLSGTTMTPAIAQAMGLPDDARGVLITGITSGGAAERAGLITSTRIRRGPGQVSISYGDVVTKIDGQAVTKYEDMVSYIFNNTKVGQTVTLTILRDGREKTVSVELGSD